MTDSVSYLEFRKYLCACSDLDPKRGIAARLLSNSALADALRDGKGDASMLQKEIDQILTDAGIKPMALGHWQLRIASFPKALKADLVISSDAAYLPWPLPLHLSSGALRNQRDPQIALMLSRLQSLNISAPTLPAEKGIGLLETWETYILDEAHFYTQGPECGGNADCVEFYADPLAELPAPQKHFTECRVGENLKEEYRLSFDAGAKKFVFWLPSATREDKTIPWGDRIPREMAPKSIQPLAAGISILSCTAKCTNFWSTMVGK